MFGEWVFKGPSSISTPSLYHFKLSIFKGVNFSCWCCCFDWSSAAAASTGQVLLLLLLLSLLLSSLGQSVSDDECFNYYKLFLLLLLLLEWQLTLNFGMMTSIATIASGSGSSRGGSGAYAAFVLLKISANTIIDCADCVCTCIHLSVC